MAVAKTFVPHFIQDISAPHVQFLLVSYFARFRPGSCSSLFPSSLSLFISAALPATFKFNSLLFVSLSGSSSSPSAASHRRGLERYLKFHEAAGFLSLIDQNKLSVDSLVQINYIVDSTGTSPPPTVHE